MPAASDFLKMLQELNKRTTAFGANHGPAGFLNRALAKYGNRVPPTMPTAIHPHQAAVEVAWTGQQWRDMQLRELARAHAAQRAKLNAGDEITQHNAR